MRGLLGKMILGSNPSLVDYVCIICCGPFFFGGCTKKKATLSPRFTSRRWAPVVVKKIAGTCSLFLEDGANYIPWLSPKVHRWSTTTNVGELFSGLIWARDASILRRRAFLLVVFELSPLANQ